MGVSAFGWTNAVKTASLAASSAETLLPVTNLAVDQGASSMAWQTLAAALSNVLLTVTPAARTTFRLFGAFRTNFTSSATMTVRLYTNPGAVLVGTLGPLTAVNGQVAGALSADLAADYVTFTFTDAGNPDNHLNIPLVFAGPGWLPVSGFSWGSALGRDDITDTVTSRGGQQYVSMRATSKRWDVGLDNVRNTEVYTQLDALDRASRVGGNVLVIPDTTSSNIQYEAAFGLLKATADIAYPFHTQTRRSWRARLTERL